jgi:hypothetical protein
MSAPTILHVIPGLRGGGAEHMLARLVTAKRAQPIKPVVADLLGGGEFEQHHPRSRCAFRSRANGYPATLPLASSADPAD